MIKLWNALVLIATTASALGLSEPRCADNTMNEDIFGAHESQAIPRNYECEKRP